MLQMTSVMKSMLGRKLPSSRFFLTWKQELWKLIALSVWWGQQQKPLIPYISTVDDGKKKSEDQQVLDVLLGGDKVWQPVSVQLIYEGLREHAR